MKSVKIKSRNPKPTEFSKNEIVINNESGRLFYKSQQGLHEVVSTFLTPLATSLSTGIDLVELGIISETTIADLEPITLSDNTNPTPENDQVTIGVSDGLFFNNSTTAELFQITTAHGICRIGPQNPYSCLFDTNKGKFAFNKRILVVGNGDTAAISSNSGENFTLFTDNFNNGENDGDFLDSANLSIRTSEAVVRVGGDVRAQSNTAGDGFNGGGNVDAERDLIYGRYVMPADGESNGLIVRGTNTGGNSRYFKITVVNGDLIAKQLLGNDFDNPYEDDTYYNG